ncbi:MAG: DUF998 domain-containing protein [bacterium]|jgi:hypothetical membrane protein|nr:DUF998 domain-containing protein [bacterium]
MPERRVVQGPASSPAFWAVATLVGVALYVVLDALLKLLRPDLGLLHNPESDYGVGPYSWVMDVTFLVRCALSLALVAALIHRIGASIAARIGTVLIVVWAVSSGLLAFFPDNPAGTPLQPHGEVHLLLALVGFLSVATGSVLVSIGVPLASRRHRALLLVISLLGVAALLALGAAGSAYIGLLERVFLGLEMLWIALTASIVLYWPQRTQSA